MGLFGRLFKARDAGATAARAPQVEADATGLAIEAVSITETGPVRDHNEDCVLVVTAEPSQPDAPPVHLIALADGMGGHQAGEVASELAIDTARSAYLREGNSDPEARIAYAMHQANAAVFAASNETAERHGMGTTLVLAALSGRLMHYAWVGDSRLYRWRDGKLEQMTEDDTLVLRLAREGLIPLDEVSQHPDRNILSQALGTHPEIPELHVGGPADVCEGDRFLLCSDGVHDVLDEIRLAETLGTGTVREVAQRLIDTAIGAGSQDNVSVCVVAAASPAQAVRAARTTATNAPLPSASAD